MTRNIYVLLVGIDKYPNPGDRLNGCVNDIEAVETFLKSRLKYNSHIKKLIDGQATRQAVINKFETHLCQAGKDDVVLFYFCGHGSQELAPKEFHDLEYYKEPGEKKLETIVCYDSRTVGEDGVKIPDIADKELRYLIAKVAKNEPHILIVFDCCHSSSGTREIDRKEGVRRTDSRPSRAYNEFCFARDPQIERNLKQGLFPEGKHVFMSACLYKETAKEITDLDGNSRGVFSYFLLRELNSLNATLSYNDLLHEVSSSVHGYRRDQTPLVEPIGMTSQELNEMSFLGDQEMIKPREPYFKLIYRPEIQGLQSGEWIVNGGVYESLVKGNELAVYPENCTFDEMKNKSGKLGDVRIDAVRLAESVVTLISEHELSKHSSYKAVLTKRSLPAVRFYLEGDIVALVQVQEKLANSLVVGIERDREKFHQYCLYARSQEFEIRDTSDNLLVHPIKGNGEYDVNKAVKQVEHIARWTKTRQLENPNSSIPKNAIDIEITYKDNVYTNSDLRLEYVGEQAPKIQLKLKNTGKLSQPLYCAILDISDSYAVSILKVFPEGGDGAWVCLNREQSYQARHSGADAENIPFGMPKEVIDQGLTEYHDVLKLIVSTEAFTNLSRFEQNKLLLADQKSREMLIEPPVVDWVTKQVTLTIVRANDNVEQTPQTEKVLSTDAQITAPSSPLPSSLGQRSNASSVFSGKNGTQPTAISSTNTLTKPTSRSSNTTNGNSSVPTNTFTSQTLLPQIQPSPLQQPAPANTNHQTRTTKWFDTTYVLAIGINKYKPPIASLDNAVNDANKIHDLFNEDCLLSGEQIVRYKLENEEATQDGIRQKLESLKTEVKENDRLIFYYAGHGIALPSQESTESESNLPNSAEGNSKPKPKNKPLGYLIPFDAEMEGRKNYLSMDDLLDWLGDIQCRHCLIILDCCYAGSIQWSLLKTREMLVEKVYPTILDNYINKKAWFILTSSDENEKANDGAPTELNQEEQLTKNTRGSSNTSNSPFVRCLEDALSGGKADVYPKDGGDKIITTAELEAYLSKVTNETSNFNGEESRQTPQRFKITGKHEGGEFVFLLNDFETIKKQLPKDPDVTADDEHNPYRGLDSFTEEKKDFFFGRKIVTEQLFNHVDNNLLTIVVGTSGAGKSSLVNAGLIPKFKEKFVAPQSSQDLNIVAQMRPGQYPADILNKKLEELNKLPSETKRLLIIDQFEEIETQCRNEQERKNFWNTLIEQLKSASKNLHIVLTLRVDFEAILRGKFESAIKECNQPKTKIFQLNRFGRSTQANNPSETKNADAEFTINWVAARFIVPAMEREQLQEAIEKPASERAVFFTSDSDPQGKIQRTLVQELVHEVAGMPGALPLLSFALYTMYRNFAQRYVNNNTIKREITWEDYTNLGDNGVLGSLTRKADEEYNNLEYKLDKVEENGKSLLKVVKDEQGKAIKEEASITKARQEMLKWVMLRMVTLDDGQVARRLVLKKELKYDERYNRTKSKQLDLVIQLFDQARLLVQGKVESGQITEEPEEKECVEPAHDALILNWEQLREWINEYKENIILRDRVLPDINDWKKLKDAEKPSKLPQHVLNNLGNSIDWVVEQLRVKGELKRLNKQENVRQKQSIAASKNGHSSYENTNSSENNAIVTAQETDQQGHANLTSQEAKGEKAPLQTHSENRQHPKSSDRLWDKESRLEVLGQQLGNLRTSKESWLNKTEADFVLQSLIKREKGRAIWKFVFFVIVLSLSGLTARVLNEQRNTLIEQVRTSRQSAEANLQANRDLEALTDILRARKTFDNWLLSILPTKQKFNIIPYTSWVHVGNSEVELTQVRGTLYKAIYGTKERNRFQLDRGIIHSVALHPKKNLLAIAGNRGTIWLFDTTTTKTQLQQFPADLRNSGQAANSNVLAIAFTPDGNWLAVGGNTQIKLWKIDDKSGKINTSSSFPVEAKDGVIDIAFNPNNNNRDPNNNNYRVATVTKDYRVKLWRFNSSNNKPIFEQENLKLNVNEKIKPEPLVYGVAFRPSKNKDQQDQLVTVGMYDIVTLWNTANNEFRELHNIKTKQTNVYSIAFTQDGKLATGGADKTVKLWEIKEQKKQPEMKPFIPFWKGQQEVFETQPNITYGMAFDASNKLVAFGEDDAVTLFNNSGSIDKRIQPQDTYVNDAIAGDMAYSPDGKLVAVIAGGRTIRLWDLTSVKQVRRFPIPIDKYGNATSLAFSPSGKEFAVGTAKGYITLWNNFGNELYSSHPQWNVNKDVSGNSSLVQSNSKPSQKTEYRAIEKIIFNDNGSKLTVFGKGNNILHQGIFSVEKQALKNFEPYPDTVKINIKDFAINPMLDTALIIDDKNNVHLREKEKQDEKKPIPTKANSVAFSPNNQFFVTAGDDGEVKVWNVKDLKKPSLTFPTHHKNIKTIAFNPINSNSLLTGGEDGTVRLWDIGNKPTQLFVKEQGINRLTLSSDGKRIATTLKKKEGKGKLLMWEWEESQGFKQKDISGTNLAEGNYIFIAFLPESSRLVTVDYNSQVKLWDSKDKQFVLLDVLDENETKQVKWVTSSKYGKILATVGEGKTIKGTKTETVKLWNFQNDKFKQINPANSELEEFQNKTGITSLALSSDGKQLATAEPEPLIGRIKLWDTSTGKKTSEFQTQQGIINSIAFSPDGKRLVTVGGNPEGKRTLRLWDVSGNPLALIQEDKIDRASFSFDGRLLAGVRSSDSQLMVWDVSGDKFNPLYGQKSDQKLGVKAFQFNANGQIATLGQNDNKVSLWPIDEKQLLAQACNLVRGYLDNPNVAESDRKLCENAPSEPINQYISAGNKILVDTTLNNPDKQLAVQAFANGDFNTAVGKLKTYRKQNPNDPEALIYLNNAIIGNQSSYTIAVSVPISSNVNGALEMLRGVAQAQNSINESGGINGRKLQVLIADDENNPELAKQIAEIFSNNSNILGIIGHYGSDTTLAASEIYNKGKLPAISPVSTSVKLSDFNLSNLFGRYTFRTVPSDKQAAQELGKYMRNNYPQSRAIIFYNSQSEYSNSLTNEFMNDIGGFKILDKIDLSDTNFNAAQSIEKALPGTVLVLMPDVDKLDNALKVVEENARRQQRLPMLAGDDVYSPKTLEKGQNKVEGMVVAVPWHIGLRRNEPFVEGSVTLWGNRDVNWRTAMSYDATQALIAAIKQNPTPTRERVAQALRSNQLQTVNWATGKVSFSSSGERSEPNIQLVKIEPGSRSGYNYDFVPVPKPNFSR